MNIPNYIVLQLKYRNGLGESTCETYSFHNDEGLSIEQINTWFEEHLILDEVLATKYGLPNLAPIRFESEVAGKIDHCYIEVSDCSTSQKVQGVNSGIQFSIVYRAMIGDTGIEGWQEMELHAVREAYNHAISMVTQFANQLGFSKQQMLETISKQA